MVERCHSCADAYLAAAEEPVCVEVIRTRCRQWPQSLLDVGAGTSGAGLRIARALSIPYAACGLQVLGCCFVANTKGDLSLSCTRFQDLETEPHDVVLMKRVLCQNTPEDQVAMIAKAAELTSDLLVVCEPWADRVPPGLPASTTSSSAPVDPSLFEDGVWERVTDVPVAPGYVAWTRFHNGCQLAYNDPARYRFSKMKGHKYAFYRVRAYRRCRRRD